MPKGIPYFFIALVNFVLFIIHKHKYGKAGGVRKTWSAVTIGFSLGTVLASWEAWFDNRDVTGFLGAAILFLTGVIMIFLNRHSDKNVKSVDV